MADWISSLVIAAVVFLIYKCVDYVIAFKKHGVPQPLEIPFMGAMGLGFVSRRHISFEVRKVYNDFKKAKYVGCHVMSERLLAVIDPELIKAVLVKNFENFAYHKTFVDENADPLFGKNLAFLNGEKWKEVRNVLSPAFTSSKMRSMHVLMSRCAKNFVDQFLHLYKDAEAVDLKDAFTRYANDVIATCAFGIEIDSLKEKNNEFYVRGRRSTNFTGIVMWKLFFLRMFPELGLKLGVRIITKADTDFFVDMIKTTIKTRDEKNITRPDMLQLMMEARGGKSDMNLVDMCAQAFIFFLGGFETTSAQICMICYELAVNPDIQKRLQDEIDDVMKETNGHPSYENVNNLTYLEAVFSETLRKHSLPFLSRVVSKDFEFPPAYPDGKPYVVPAGLEIMIPVAGIHHDPEIYDEPERFDPERFLDKKAATGDVTSLGFGLGPRMCIGNRFAILEAKVLFVHLLSRCTLVPCKKTCIPLEYDMVNFSPSPKGGSWVKLEPRS